MPLPAELSNNGVVKYVGGAARAAAEEQTTGERRTRNRVASSILGHGPSTAADLAERLGLTQAAVRRHLDALVAENIVEARDQRVYGSRGRGRPAKVFALTDCGRDAFDQAYDQLAADALGWIAQSAGGGEQGEAAVTAFARARVAAQAERYRELIDAAAPDERAQALARALTADGYAATARSAPARPGSSCANTTARWLTPPSSTRSSARRRPRSSPACSGPTSSGLPPSRTATGCAPRSSRRPTRAGPPRHPRNRQHPHHPYDHPQHHPIRPRSPRPPQDPRPRYRQQNPQNP